MKKAKLNNNKRINKKEEVVSNDEISLKKIVIVMVSILIVFVAFYFLTDYLISKRTTKVTPSDTTQVKDDEISFNELYKQKDKTYYVLAILNDDKNKDKYTIYQNEISPLYYIDMNDAFNKSHIGETDVVTENIKDIVISDTTLFVVKENKLESYHVGYENIVNYALSKAETSEQ